MLFANLDAELLNTFGEAATYTPSGGGPVSLQVLIEKDVQEFDGGYVSERQTHALIADRTINPSANATLQVGATTYTVSCLVADDGRLMRLLVV